MAVIVSKQIALPKTFDKTLENNSWEEIRNASDSGVAQLYWSVGDSKIIVLNGTIAGKKYVNGPVIVSIIGFDHNASVEGTNRIHFQINKVLDTQIALCDTSYGALNSSTCFHMNSSSSNSGGWNNSFMRKTVLGNKDNASGFFAALPEDLQAVIKPVTKYTDNTGNGNTQAGSVTATEDYITLLSEFEVFGARTYANTSERNFQLQYEYYKKYSKIRMKDTSTSTAAKWWLRSPNSTNNGSFCDVNTPGTADYYPASYSFGIAPIFCV